MTNLGDDNCVDIEAAELNIIEIDAAILGLEQLYQQTINEGASCALVAGVESIIDATMNEDYPSQAFTSYPSELNRDVALEGILTSLSSMITKGIEAIFAIIRAVLDTIAKAIRRLVGLLTGDTVKRTSSYLSGSNTSRRGYKVKTEDIDATIVNDEVKNKWESIRTLLEKIGLNVSEDKNWKKITVSMGADLDSLNTLVEDWRGGLVHIDTLENVGDIADSLNDRIKYDLCDLANSHLGTLYDTFTQHAFENLKKYSGTQPKPAHVEREFDDAFDEAFDDVEEYVKIINENLIIPTCADLKLPHRSLVIDFKKDIKGDKQLFTTEFATSINAIRTETTEPVTNKPKGIFLLSLDTVTVDEEKIEKIEKACAKKSTEFETASEVVQVRREKELKYDILNAAGIEYSDKYTNSYNKVKIDFFKKVQKIYNIHATHVRVIGLFFGLLQSIVTARANTNLKAAKVISAVVRFTDKAHEKINGSTSGAPTYAQNNATVVNVREEAVPDLDLRSNYSEDIPRPNNDRRNTDTNFNIGYDGNYEMR